MPGRPTQGDLIDRKAGGEPTDAGRDGATYEFAEAGPVAGNDDPSGVFPTSRPARVSATLAPSSSV